MCARANSASVSDSLYVVVHSILAVAIAIAVLAVAITTAPWRALRSKPARHGKPAATGHIEIQVHLAEARRVRDIQRSCRAALNRAARTWAPFPLPLDRVEVLSSAPALGKADIFEHWTSASSDGLPNAGALVVVSVGTAAQGRDLFPDEIAGALAAQIEKLVIDRYRREHPQPSSPPAGRTGDARSAVPVPETGLESTPGRVQHSDNVTDLGSVRALLADIKKSQPLVPAGSFTNGHNPEADPAS